MIIIPTKQTKSTIFIPKNSHDTQNSLVLRIKSMSTLNTKTYYVNNESSERDFYKVTFQHNLSDGEYECKLLSYEIPDMVLESFIIRVGSYKETRKVENKQYNKEVTYVEYKG